MTLTEAYEALVKLPQCGEEVHTEMGSDPKKSGPDIDRLFRMKKLRLRIRKRFEELCRLA